MQVCRYALVSGRVQGVGFRQFVQRAARREGVTGWARNLPDGRVEVLLCGAADAVDTVAAAVAEGPPAGRVSSLAWEERPFEAVSGFDTY